MHLFMRPACLLRPWYGALARHMKRVAVPFIFFAAFDIARDIQSAGTHSDVSGLETHDTTPMRVGTPDHIGKTDSQGVENSGLADPVDANDKVESGPEMELRRLDRADVRQSEARDLHAARSKSIWPVTAAAIRVARRSLSSAMVSRVLSASSSSRFVSWSR